jgi:DnaJ domain
VVLECIEMRDPYAVLGVPQSATAKDIKNCYRRLAKALHPDGNRNDPKAGARFAELTAAYEILGDGGKRKAFDRGAIDAQGRPVRRGLAARLAAQPIAAGLTIIAAGLTIILLMPAATIIRTFTEPDEIHVNSHVNSIVKETALRSEEANDGQTGAAHAQPPAPRLIFQLSASYAAINAAPLGIQVSGQASGVALEISGLPLGMTISSGRALGAGRWRILATDLADAMIYPPPGFDGAVDLQVELKLADDTVIDRGSLHREWRQSPSVAASPIESAGGASNPTTAYDNVNAAAQLDQAEIDFLIRRSQKLITDGDIEAARILLRRAAEAHDARAALALGASYDPIMLAKLKVQGIGGDTSLARRWYKKAAEFGSPEAQERLNVLGP